MAMIERPISEERYRTDLLTLPQKINMAMAQPRVKGSIYLALPVLGLVFPYFMVVVPLFMLWFVFVRPSMEFPARMPREANKLDKSDTAPGGKGYRKARGEVYLGYHRGTGKEAWGAWDDMLTHLYMLAATGGGKSEALWAILANFYCSGSAYTLSDGKGTLEMVRNGRILARLFGVEDDYFVINYISPSKEYSQKAMSNSINTWAHGTGGQLKEQLSSLALSGDAGQNQFFEDNAESLIERAFPALVELRDKGVISLDIQTIGKYIQMDKLYDLTQHPDVSDLNQRNIKDFLIQVGFNFDNPRKQGEEVVKMYGQFSSHFAKTISSLSIQYRDIYVVDQGDVNMKDITSNRRTLMNALPSLEKSGSELSNLGNILLTSQKNAISTDLGDILEGTNEETLLRLSKNYRIPYALGFDEWSFYAIQDMALLPAQIRGLRYCGIYAAQDYAGTERAGEMDAEQVFANTRFKFFGALEEAGKSWTRIRDLMGEFLVAVNDNYKYLPGLFGGRQIVDREKTSVQRRAPIEIKDLQKQVEGQFFMFMRGKLSPIQFYYTDLGGMGKKAAEGNAFKLNRLCRVYPPSDVVMKTIEQDESFLDIMYSTGKLFTDLGNLRSLQKGLVSLRHSHESKPTDMVHVINGWVEENASRLGIDLLPKAAAAPKGKPESLSPAALSSNTPPHEPPADTVTPAEPEMAAGASDSTEEASGQDDSDPFGGFDSMAGFAALTGDQGPAPDDFDATKQVYEQTSVSTPPRPIDEPEPEVEPSRAPATPSSPAPGKGEQDLEQATLEAKRAIIDSENPPEGAHVLSELEARELQSDMAEINVLLGVDPDSASSLARGTVDKLERHCYYLAPPKPMTLDTQSITELQHRVDELLK